MLKRYKLRDYDFKLVLLLLAVSGIGVLLVGSAEKSLQIKQFAGIVMGVVLMLLISLMDYSWILNFYWLMYFANIGMLLFLRVFGANKFGATRWIDLGFFQFQPTELAKLIIILFFAKYLMKHVEELNTFRTIIKALVLLIVPLVLIAIQPDLKNTITVVVIFCGIMYMAGLSYKVIGGISAVVIPLVIVSLIVLTQTDIKIPEKLEYQRTRVMAWLYPENAEYSDDIIQQQNSIIAIGSGQLSGKGLDNNKVSSANKGNFVSQIHNDFIFAVAGEELGFLGSSLIVILLFVISLVCINIGKRAKDLAGSILCSGIGIMVAFQSFINICVATGLFPNTGTPLPFVSYGLTSMVSLYISMGLVLNVGLQGKKIRKENTMNIGLIAHDAKKKLLQNFCTAYRGILSKHELYATGTSGRLIEEASGLTVHKFLAGHVGGEQQLAAEINNNNIDLLIFLRDPYNPKKHEPVANNLFKLCDTHNIPLATNLACAELMIKSMDRGELEWREIYKK